MYRKDETHHTLYNGSNHAFDFFPHFFPVLHVSLHRRRWVAGFFEPPQKIPFHVPYWNCHTDARTYIAFRMCQTPSSPSLSLFLSIYSGLFDALSNWNTRYTFIYIYWDKYWRIGASLILQTKLRNKLVMQYSQLSTRICVPYAVSLQPKTTWNRYSC